MKRVLILTVLLSIAALSACGTKENNTSNTADNGETTVGIANPWTDSDRGGVLDATGFDLSVPEGAENVAYSYMQEESLAQVSYVLDGNEWTYRVRPTEHLEDLSGMCYEWDIEEDGTVGDMEAKIYAYSEADEDSEFIDDVFSVHVVNWYDDVEKATHSLSVSGKNLDGLDIQAVAEKMQ